MASQIVTITSGVVASPVFALDPTNRGFAVQVPSYNTATLLQVHFGTALDASTLTFGPVTRGDGTGGFTSIFSISAGGPSWGVFPSPPTPFMRLVFNPAATITLSCVVVPLLR